MSYPDAAKTVESETGTGSNASSADPRTFASLEHEVRGDIKHLVRNRLLRGLGLDIEEDEIEERTENELGIENMDITQTASDELNTLALEFVACVAEEKRCDSHRMRLRLERSLAPGVVIDTPGASVFFWRFWETVVDSATASKPQLWVPGEKSLIVAHDWESLEEARRTADSKMDRAIELVNMAQRIDCAVTAGWSVWSKPGRWADLPLLEPIVKDCQFGLFSAISHHEDIMTPRIQRYICGANLPEPDQVNRGAVRDLIALRWKWLQLQRFSALLWNTAGRAEYLPHAIRVLDALANFSPQETELPLLRNATPDVIDESRNSTSQANKDTPKSDCKTILSDGTVEDNSAAAKNTEAVDANDAKLVIRPLELSDDDPWTEPFEEWSEPPVAQPPTVLQLLLAEGAAVWLLEAMPAIRRYVQGAPLTDSERARFESLQETRREREERWAKWRRGLEMVSAWCANERSGMPREATLVTRVAHALRTMAQAEKPQPETKGQAFL